MCQKKWAGSALGKASIAQGLKHNETRDKPSRNNINNLKTKLNISIKNIKFNKIFLIPRFWVRLKIFFIVFSTRGKEQEWISNENKANRYLHKANWLSQSVFKAHERNIWMEREEFGTKSDFATILDHKIVDTAGLHFALKGKQEKLLDSSRKKGF